MSPKVKIEVDSYGCIRCGHQWVPRPEEHPTICPKCKSPTGIEKGNEKGRVRLLPDLYICLYCGKGFQGRTKRNSHEKDVPQTMKLGNEALLKAYEREAA